jgi:RNA polymerase sigma factor (sigma-70 family)
VTPKSLIEPARHAGTALLRSQTDARLVDLTREGNERAFEAIVQRYRKPLLRYCSRVLSPTRAEDAVQQAFLSAHRGIHAGDAELNLRPWLYRIAHNASLNLLRQNGFDHDEVSEDIDGVETPPQAFERVERLRTVVSAVKELPERQRDAIVLQALEGRSYDEIAVELGVSDGAVRQLLNRARNTLREAAAAVTPTGLLARLGSSGGEVTVAERVAQVVGGAGGGALLAKAGAAIVVAGAVAGGAATGSLPLTGHHRDAHAASGGSAAVASGTQIGAGGVVAGGSGVRRENVVLTSPGGRAGGHGSSSAGQLSSRSGSSDGLTHGGSGGPSRGHDGGGSGRDGGGSGSSGDSSSHGGGSDSGSGSGSSGADDGSGQSGSGSSGSGSSGSGSDGSGSGSDGGGSSSSGSGSGSGSGSSSGSGGSDDPSSTPAPATAVTPVESHSGSGSSGSGSSGSGSSGSDKTSGGDGTPDDSTDPTR